MRPCDVADTGVAFPASERDVSKEQQVVLSRAARVISLSFPICPDDLNK